MAEAGGHLVVNLEKIKTGKTITVTYSDENGNNLGGGDYIVDLDGDGVANYSELSLPEGYKLKETGDFLVEDGGKYTVVLEKIVDGTVINVVFVDEAGNNLGGGDCLVDLDNDGVANFSELTLPDGYELVKTGDFFVKDFEGKTNTITVRKISKGSIVKVVFVDEAGNNLGGGDFFVDADGDGIANYNEFALPDGYELIKTGDFFVKDFEGKTTTITLQKIVKDTIINVVYVDEEGNVLGGGDYIVDPDGDGIANYGELTLPAGYELITTGDFFVENGASYTVVLKPVVKAKTINVVFVDENGKNLGGGDYIVDLDGDGIANYNELSLPEGYKLKETGDFFVEDGGKYTVVLDKIVDGTVVNVVFVDEAGNSLGGGDYRVDLDNDGIANYSELTLPAGYELITTGDFFVKDFEGKTNTIILRKISKGSIVNVVFVDEDGNNLGGGDYYIDADGDGIANYNEFTLPEGYALITTGDFFVKDFEGKTTTITLQKIVKDTIINVVFVDEEGNNLGGGDFLVDPDGDGIANYSELTLPVGYELITTGDFFVENGASYTITLRAIKTEEEAEYATLNVKIIDSKTGEELSTKEFTSADKGQADQTYTFVYGEDYEVNIPKGYKLYKDVEPTDITVNYGSSRTVAFYVTKDEGKENTESTEEVNKEDSSKTDGVNTGVATALSASVAGVAASGIGILGLLRKKRNKK